MSAATGRISRPNLQDANHADPTPTPPPTLGEYLPTVIDAAGPYGTYWTRMVTRWGDRRLDEIAASEIEAMRRITVATARKRRTSRNGRHAGEHFIAAARAIYNRAIADDLIDQKASPAHRVAKPRRLPSTQRALTAWGARADQRRRAVLRR